MKSSPRTAMLFAAAILLALPSAASAETQKFSPEQRHEIEGIVKEYLLAHPEVMQDVIAELDKRQQAAELEKHRSAVEENSKALFSSPHQVVLGNPQGNVTMVEFFDYNCGFCRRALTDKLELVKADPKLRLVLKEFPVLGEGSTQAAQVAVSVRLQDKTGGKKYLDFHQKMFNGRGQADKARALAVAKEIGLDMARLEKDMASEEVKTTLAESFKLAEGMVLNRTPSYVVGTNTLIRAVGPDTFREND